MSKGEMQKDAIKNDVIKKENRKALKVFIPVIITAGLIGGFFGYFSMTEGFQGFFGNLGYYVGEGFFRIIPYLVILTEVLTFGISLLYYKKAKRYFAGYEELAVQAVTDEDEERLDEIIRKTDRTLSISMITDNLGMILSFLFFGIFMSYLIRMLEAEIFILPVLAILFFLAGMFINMKLQQLAVDLVKKMNPKMKGSIYDLQFSKKWEASCDEAEKMTIYRASYKGFRAANLACTAMWMLLCLGDMLLHYGPLPVASVSVIWIVMLVSYYIENFKLEHGKINE